MASKLKETTLDFGFVQVPVSVFPAAKDDELDLRSLCCEQPPKMTIRCGACSTEYSSWQKVPQRGYEQYRGEYVVLSPQEIAQAREAKARVDTVKVEKAVDFLKMGSKYVLGKAYYLLPPAGANQTTLGTYRTIHEVIWESGRAILCRFAPRDRVRHYAIIADPQGALVAYEVLERRELPYAVPTAPADPKKKVQGEALIGSLYSEDVALEPEPDPVFELIQAKISAKAALESIPAQAAQQVLTTERP